LVAEFLDNRSTLLASVPSGTEDPTSVVLGNLKDLSGLGLSEPNWRRTTILGQLSSVEGVLTDSDHTTLYLTGKQRHAVQVFKTGRVEILDEKASAAEYRAFCRRDIQSHSTSDMALFDVERLANGGRELFIGGQVIAITASEYATLKSGRRLFGSHPLNIALNSHPETAKVLYSNPMMQKQGQALLDADEFTFALQRAYPNATIYRDPLSPRTNELVRKLNSYKIGASSNVVAIVADDSFQPRPKDYNLVQDMKHELEQAGVRVLSYKSGTKLASVSNDGKGIIVITGHSSEEMAAFVRSLGAQGVFQSNFIVFNSCETPLNRQLIAEINTRYGAIATFAHQGAIRVNDLDPFLGTLVQRIAPSSQETFQRTLIESLHEYGLNGVWTICRLFADGWARLA